VGLEPRVTVFSGANGQGKSNFLEAAYYALSFRSFRTSSNADLVRWGLPEATLEARLNLRGLDRTLRVQIVGARKSTQLDGKGIRRDSDGLVGAGVVVFGPEDLRLPKGAASERRRALDRTVFSVHRGYLREAVSFERALKARNGILRKGGFRVELLESYDETLAQTGARVVLRRRAVANALAPRYASAFSEIHGDLPASMRYRSDERVEQATSEDEIRAALREGLRAERARDERRGFTGYGPQTDDVELFLGGRVAREHGSQGQIRSLVLALKLAELRYVEEQNQEMPVLLLDDVASELDETRRARLFETISAMACQTLITVTEREHLPELPGRVDWRVQGGRLELW
jgi:DNA replication and repair protein RecF